MKTLANCTPIEFVKQTNKIRKAVNKWMDDTNIIGIRARKPQLIKFDKNMTAEEREAAFAANKEAVRKQAILNLNDMLDAILEDHPEETLEILALVCFIEPEKVNDFPMRDYLNVISQILADEAVISFFTSLAQLGRNNILTA